MGVGYLATPLQLGDDAYPLTPATASEARPSPVWPRLRGMGLKAPEAFNLRKVDPRRGPLQATDPSGLSVAIKSPFAPARAGSKGGTPYLWVSKGPPLDGGLGAVAPQSPQGRP